MSKTASDLLQEIADKLDTLIALHNNSDTNIKVMLSRMNKGVQPSQVSDVSSNTERVSDTQPVTTISLSPVKEAVLNELPLGGNVRRTSRAEMAEEVEFIEAEEKPISNKEVNVYQLVKGDADKVIFMARVLIFKNHPDVLSKDPMSLTNTDLFVTESKTNGAGRWQGRLKPSKYLCYICKIDVATKSKYVSLSEINVVDSVIPLELPVCKLIRVKDSI